MCDWFILMHYYVISEEQRISHVRRFNKNAAGNVKIDFLFVIFSKHICQNQILFSISSANKKVPIAYCRQTDIMLQFFPNIVIIDNTALRE